MGGNSNLVRRRQRRGTIQERSPKACIDALSEDLLNKILEYLLPSHGYATYYNSSTAINLCSVSKTFQRILYSASPFRGLTRAWKACRSCNGDLQLSFKRKVACPIIGGAKKFDNCCDFDCEALICFECSDVSRSSLVCESCEEPFCKHCITGYTCSRCKTVACDLCNFIYQCQICREILCVDCVGFLYCDDCGSAYCENCDHIHDLFRSQPYNNCCKNCCIHCNEITS